MLWYFLECSISKLKSTPTLAQTGSCISLLCLVVLQGRYFTSCSSCYEVLCYISSHVTFLVLHVGDHVWSTWSCDILNWVVVRWRIDFWWQCTFERIVIMSKTSVRSWSPNVLGSVSVLKPVPVGVLLVSNKIYHSIVKRVAFALEKKNSEHSLPLKLTKWAFYEQL